MVLRKHAKQFYLRIVTEINRPKCAQWLISPIHTILYFDLILYDPVFITNKYMSGYFNVAVVQREAYPRCFLKYVDLYIGSTVLNLLNRTIFARKLSGVEVYGA